MQAVEFPVPFLLQCLSIIFIPTKHLQEKRTNKREIILVIPRRKTNLTPTVGSINDILSLCFILDVYCSYREGYFNTLFVKLFFKCFYEFMFDYILRDVILSSHDYRKINV